MADLETPPLPIKPNATNYYPPWLQRKGEKDNHYKAFYFYLTQGPLRSISGAYQNYFEQKKRHNKRRKQWNKIIASPAWHAWAKDNDWENRARAYDLHLMNEDHRIMLQRRRELLQRQYSLGERVLEKADLMLQFPVAETVSKDGKTIIKPADWSARDAVGFVEAGLRVSRQALEMSEADISIKIGKETAAEDITPGHLQDIQWLKEIDAPLADELTAQTISATLPPEQGVPGEKPAIKVKVKRIKRKSSKMDTKAKAKKLFLSRRKQ